MSIVIAPEIQLGFPFLNAPLELVNVSNSKYTRVTNQEQEWQTMWRLLEHEWDQRIDQQHSEYCSMGKMINTLVWTMSDDA